MKTAKCTSGTAELFFEKTRPSVHEEITMKNIQCDAMPSEASLVLKRNLKTRIGKPVRISGIYKIDVVEPQTLQASVGVNKS